MTLLAEQATPGWVPIVILLIPVTIMAVLFWTGARYRIRARQVKRTDARRHGASETRLGSAQEITDPSGYKWEALLQALALEPEDDGPMPDGTPFNDAYYAKMLGLKARLVSGNEPFPEPNVLWGKRPAGQVFIRSGPDERAAGGASMTNRHYRHITVLRVAAPAFEIRSEEGVMRPSDDAPPEVGGLLGLLASDPTVWHQTLLVSDVEGIVATRPAADPLPMAWIYDLWLCERIAQRLRLAPLPNARLSPEWKVPYKLGKHFTAARA